MIQYSCEVGSAHERSLKMFLKHFNLNTQASLLFALENFVFIIKRVLNHDTVWFVIVKDKCEWIECIDCWNGWWYEYVDKCIDMNMYILMHSNECNQCKGVGLF